MNSRFLGRLSKARRSIRLVTSVLLAFYLTGCTSEFVEQETAVTSDTRTADELAPEEQEVAPQSTTGPSLNALQKQRADLVLDQVGRDDPILNVVVNCVAVSYEELNAGFLDLDDRSRNFGIIMDCVESSGVQATCGEADNGTGPICGIPGGRAGYSLVTIFGAMAGG